MQEMLWQVISESKGNQPYLSSKEQFNNLVGILSSHDITKVHQLRDVWEEKREELLGDDFNKLHIQFGGIVDSGDDGFFLDFANWVIAQGEELFNAFKKEGSHAVLDYISKHQVDEDDYLFESMGYVFSHVLRKMK